jgi:hypothetical protein
LAVNTANSNGNLSVRSDVGDIVGCGTDQAEDVKDEEGCYVERATKSDYIHNQDELAGDEESRERCSSHVLCELRCRADIAQNRKGSVRSAMLEWHHVVQPGSRRFLSCSLKLRHLQSFSLQPPLHRQERNGSSFFSRLLMARMSASEHGESSRLDAVVRSSSISRIAGNSRGMCSFVMLAWPMTYSRSSVIFPMLSVDHIIPPAMVQSSSVSTEWPIRKLGRIISVSPGPRWTPLTVPFSDAHHELSLANVDLVS